MDQTAVTAELFTIPEEGGAYLVYAPIQGVVLRTTVGGVNVLARVQAGRATASDLDSPLVSALTEAGVLGVPFVPPSCSPVSASYAPTRVTLLLTTRCNLACRYCYAGDHSGPGQTIPLEIGQAAIATTAAYCKKRGVKTLSLGFHGGGEPTEAWNELVAFVEYAKAVCDEQGLKLDVGVATNGCLTDEKAEWLAKNVSSINLSLDGPPDIQNRNRPMRGGGESSGRILAFLKRLEQAGVPYGVQSTVTSETVDRMPEIVRYLATHTKANLIKFEPACTCGRFLEHGDEVPDPTAFTRFFNQAFDEGWQCGARVAFSGVRIFAGVLSTFCGAFCEPFAVTPDGNVSACFEVYDAKSKYADTFLIGAYDSASGGFVMDETKLARLRTRTVANLTACRDCFCKYMCAGDCATRSFRFHGGNDLLQAGGRCETIRMIAKHQLGHYVNLQSQKREDNVEEEIAS